MEVKERIAYVRGLLEGSEAMKNDQTALTLWGNLLHVCDQLADSIEELEEAHDEIEEYLEVVDADLCDLEEEVLGSGTLLHSETVEELDDDELELDDDEEEYVRADCPRCGEEVYFEEGFLYDEGVEVSCPDCGEILYRSETNGRLDLPDPEKEVPKQASSYGDDARSPH